jgi:hypothetical protein
VLSDDSRWALTQRIAQSEGFRRAPRLRAFLLYVAEHQLTRPEVELNEYQIATSVFDRPASFNPVEESIVRSSARQLRAKLHEYFEGGRLPAGTNAMLRAVPEASRTGQNRAANVHITVVRVPREPKTSPLQLPVELVEHDVTEQGRPHGLNAKENSMGKPLVRPLRLEDI